MQIQFSFPSTLHPSGDISVLELANILESRYEPVYHFLKNNQEKINKKLENEIQRREQISAHKVCEWLKEEWRNYARAGKLADGTHAHFKRIDGRPLIDTQTYFLGLQPVIVFTDAERKCGLCVD